LYIEIHKKNLDYAFCRTSSVADTLAVSVRSGPQTVSLQRCFGIGPTAAGNLLAAAAVNGSRLQCILFSHLDRLDIPRDTSLIETEGNDTEAGKGLHPHMLNLSISAGVGLRILALNNCASLGPFDLVAVVRVLYANFSHFVRFYLMLFDLYTIILDNS
jgi:hypothetical protein